MVRNLTNLDPSRGPITLEQAQFWKQEFEKLIKAGADGVPAIREFLEKNIDVNIKSAQGGDQLGVSSLRLAMFDALRQIGGTEAAGAAAQIMLNTPNPREVAILASDLEAMAPGQYNDSAVAAARTALARAGQDTSLVDVAPLFQVLQNYGGANALSDFQQAANKWNYYAPIALAQLPDGTGIPMLAQMAQNTDGTFASSSKFALRMLAELAPQYPDAANILVDQLKNSQVSNRTWVDLAAALDGEKSFYSDTGYLNTSTPATNSTNFKTWHMAATDQNWQSVNVSGNWTPQQIQNQLDLIDRIIAANPAARGPLESTRAALAAKRVP